MAGRVRENYIDGIKALACFSVFIYHFNLAFEFIFPSIYNTIMKYTPLAISADGNYMVYLFCIISGYLVSYTKIENIKQLLMKCVSRYFRLVIPILAAMLLVWVMEVGIGFSINEAKQLTPNYEIGNYYQNPITLPFIIYEAFIKVWYTSSAIITPLWMIRYILYGSFLIYTYNYLAYKFPKLQWPILGLYVGVLAMLDFKTWMTLTTFLGVLVVKLKSEAKLPTFLRAKAFNVITLLLCVVLVWFGHSTLFHLINKVIHLPNMLDLNGHWKTIYAFALFYCIGNIERIKKALSCRWLLKVSQMAMALFLLHFPWICSFSLKLYFAVFTQMQPGLAYVILLIITTLTVLIISYVFHSLVEENIGRMMKRIFK